MMRNFYLPGLIILLNILAAAGVAAQDPPPRKGVVVSSPTGLKPRPDNLPIPNPNGIIVKNSNAGRDIPDHIVYGTVFRIAAASWLPEKVKFNPHEIEICKRYRIEKILSEREEKFLQELARKTVDDLNNLANRARPLMEEFRAKLRSGTVRGEGRPIPPPELEEISKQRIALVEEAIAALKKKFSEKSFAKFTAFVDENIRSNFKKGTVIVPQ